MTGARVITAAIGITAVCLILLAGITRLLTALGFGPAATLFIAGIVTTSAAYGLVRLAARWSARRRRR